MSQLAKRISLYQQNSTITNRDGIQSFVFQLQAGRFFVSIKNECFNGPSPKTLHLHSIEIAQNFCCESTLRLVNKTAASAASAQQGQQVVARRRQAVSVVPRFFNGGTSTPQQTEATESTNVILPKDSVEYEVSLQSLHTSHSASSLNFSASSGAKRSFATLKIELTTQIQSDIAFTINIVQEAVKVFESKRALTAENSIDVREVSVAPGEYCLFLGLETLRPLLQQLAKQPVDEVVALLSGSRFTLSAGAMKDSPDFAFDDSMQLDVATILLDGYRKLQDGKRTMVEDILELSLGRRTSSFVVPQVGQNNQSVVTIQSELFGWKLPNSFVFRLELVQTSGSLKSISTQERFAGKIARFSQALDRAKAQRDLQGANDLVESLSLLESTQDASVLKCLEEARKLLLLLQQEHKWTDAIRKAIEQKNGAEIQRLIQEHSADFVGTDQLLKDAHAQLTFPLSAPSQEPVAREPPADLLQRVDKAIREKDLRQLQQLLLEEKSLQDSQRPTRRTIVKILPIRPDSSQEISPLRTRLEQAIDQIVHQIQSLSLELEQAIDSHEHDVVEKVLQQFTNDGIAQHLPQQLRQRADDFLQEKKRKQHHVHFPEVPTKEELHHHQQHVTVVDVDVYDDDYEDYVDTEELFDEDAVGDIVHALQTDEDDVEMEDNEPTLGATEEEARPVDGDDNVPQTLSNEDQGDTSYREADEIENMAEQPAVHSELPSEVAEVARIAAEEEVNQRTCDQPPPQVAEIQRDVEPVVIDSHALETQVISVSDCPEGSDGLADSEPVVTEESVQQAEDSDSSIRKSSDASQETHDSMETDDSTREVEIANEKTPTRTFGNIEEIIQQIETGQLSQLDFMDVDMVLDDIDEEELIRYVAEANDEVSQYHGQLETLAAQQLRERLAQLPSIEIESCTSTSDNQYLRGPTLSELFGGEEDDTLDNPDAVLDDISVDEKPAPTRPESSQTDSVESNQAPTSQPLENIEQHVRFADTVAVVAPRPSRRKSTVDREQQAQLLRQALNQQKQAQVQSSAPKGENHLLQQATRRHPVLQRVHLAIVELQKNAKQFQTIRQQTNAGVPQERKVIVIKSNDPNMLLLVKAILGVISNRMRPAGVGKERSMFDLLAPVDFMAKFLSDFNNLDTVRQHSDDIKTKQVLFVQYALDRKSLFNIVFNLSKLFALMDDNYEPDSVMLDFALRGEIFGMLKFIEDNFLFQFDFPPPVSSEVALLFPQLKQFVRSILQYVMETSQRLLAKARNHRNSLKLDHQQLLLHVSDESINPSIGPLVRNTVCRCLLGIMSHKFKENMSLFKKTYLWDLIVQMSNSPTSKQIILKGVDMTTAVNTVQEFVQLKKSSVDKSEQRHQKKILSDARCVAFFCFCINYRIIDKMFQLIFSHQTLINKYYEPEAVMLSQQCYEKVVEFLQPLTEVPFRLMYRSSEDVHQ